MAPLLLWLLVMLCSQRMVCGMLRAAPAAAQLPNCQSSSVLSTRRGLVQQSWRAAACPAPQPCHDKWWQRKASRRSEPSAKIDDAELGFASILFAVVNVGGFLFLAAHSAGLVRPVQISAHRVWMVIPVSQVFILVAHMGIGPFVGATFANGEYGPQNMAWAAWTAFSMLLLQAVMFVALCRAGPKGKLVYIMYYPTAICLAALSYYARIIYSTPNVVAADALGMHLYPEHHVLWQASTSMQCLLWYHMHALECAGKFSCRLPSTPLLLSMLMMWSGLLGLLDYGPCGVLTYAPNVILSLVCTATLYALLTVATRPLFLCAADYKRRNMPVTHAQFRGGALRHP